MTTIIINNKSKAARLMIEYLKTQSYAKIIEEEQLNYSVRESLEKSKQDNVISGKVQDEFDNKSEKEPNTQTKRAIREVQQGKVTYCDDVEDMLNKLKA